jgi:hypothetical protein
MEFSQLARRLSRPIDIEAIIAFSSFFFFFFFSDNTIIPSRKVKKKRFKVVLADGMKIMLNPTQVD